MSILGKIGQAFVGGAAEPVQAVGTVLDSLFTSDEERLDKKILIERLRQQPALAQVALNQVEAQHRSLFVAGWRPSLGWICAMGLAFTFLVNPVLQWLTGQPGPELPTNIMLELVLGMLGLGALRTVEKLSGRAK